MSAKETTIRLDSRDIDLLERGGSISYELKSAANVVWVSMKDPPRRTRPSMTPEPEKRDVPTASEH